MKGKFVVKNRKIELKNFKKIMFKIPTKHIKFSQYFQSFYKKDLN